MEGSTELRIRIASYFLATLVVSLTLTGFLSNPFSGIGRSIDSLVHTVSATSEGDDGGSNGDEGESTGDNGGDQGGESGTQTQKEILARSQKEKSPQT